MEAGDRFESSTSRLWNGELAEARRIVFVGRTGSGKTTLARDVAILLSRTHIELDSLYFRSDLSTVPLDELRERTAAALADDCWIVDGNKSAVRDIVWPRADTIVWLDYPLIVSLWRLGRRAIKRTAGVTATSNGSSGSGSSSWRRIPRHLLLAARGVITALRSHAGQRRTYPCLLALPEYQHLRVLRLRSARTTRAWLDRVTLAASTP